MIELRILENTAVEIIYQTFLAAFSDYPIKLGPTLEDYQKMLKRRGFNRSVSIGAFQDGELIGFILNGVRTVGDKLTAYNIMTGIVPSSRGKGLAKKMFSVIIKILTTAGVDQYTLEVLKQNTRAFERYKKIGFEVTKNYDVFKLTKKIEPCPITMLKTEMVSSRSEALIDLFCIGREYDFSWQNSLDSIYSMPESFNFIVVSLNGLNIGYGIVDKKTGDVPQFALQYNYHNLGIENQLFIALLNNTESQTISVVNIEKKQTALNKPLLKAGFEKVDSQYGMTLLFS